MNYNVRRSPLPRGRRIALNINISPATYRLLMKLCRGNRSAAVEELGRFYLERQAQAPQEQPEVA